MKKQISEAKLNKIIDCAVNEAIKKVIKRKSNISESLIIAKNVPAEVQKAYLKKMVNQYPDLDPNGFFYVGNTLKHNEKKRSKSSQKARPPKPNGMSLDEYMNNFIPKYNSRFKKGLDLANSNGNIEWRPIDVTRYTKGDSEMAEAFSNRYMISNYGDVCVLNINDATASHITLPYFDSSTKNFQINLRIYDNNGNEILHLCPPTVVLVRDAFGEDAAKGLKEMQKQRATNIGIGKNDNGCEF